MNYQAEMKVKRAMMARNIHTIPISRSYGYTYAIDFWKAIRIGSFPEKQKLADDLGLTVQEIWG